jgi:uncharacterized protein
MRTESKEELARRYHEFLGNKEFPCVGAKAALAKEQVSVYVADHIGCPYQDREILEFLYSFLESYASDTLYITAAVVFEHPENISEDEFDKFFWTRLQNLANLDAEKFGYDPLVARDPEDTAFSFSLHGQAFYIVGLHPNNSRKARQFSNPAIVFNPHAQFDHLKAIRKYEGLKHAIRTRDLNYSGSVNPMLADFGESSEATQYTGMQYDRNWKCPFIAHHADH